MANEHDDEAAAVDPRTAARADMTQKVHSRERTKITAFAHTRMVTAAPKATAEVNRAVVKHNKRGRKRSKTPHGHVLP